ncbi:MAG: S-layer homology domain-containing protein, partial [Clostridia bacterium]|nr:S-layer homology domain-containing protein [Clostridia bacterium]
MRKFLTLLSLLLCISAVQVCAAESAIYVDAINGNVSGDGSFAKPYKNIEQAQKAVRAINKSMKDDIVVYLRAGTYYVDTALEFDENDSGFNGHIVKWVAYGNEKPVISGGKTVTGWSLHDSEKNIYSAGASGIETRQLIINGVRAQRARSEGNLLPDDAQYDNGVVGYTCSHTDMVSWKNQSNIEFVYKNEWTNSRCPVQSITETDGKTIITMQQPGWKSVRVGKTGKLSVTYPWYIENAYELLDEPGEFYLDLAADKFYYIPRDGEDMSKAEVIAPCAETLIKAAGSDLDSFIHDITFEGISFRYTTWLRPGHEKGFADNQNATIRDTVDGPRDLFPPAMVEVQRGRNIDVIGCEFAHAGAISLKMTEGIDQSTVEGNHIYNGAAHGIVMGEITCQDQDNHRWNPSDTRLYMIRNKINNNFVHDVGLDYKSSAAVSIGFLIDSEVCHNEITDVPYSGFHICYGFQTYSFEEGTVFRNVKINNNFVQNTMNDEIFDGGSIYVLGSSGGDENNMVEISGNYLKDQNDVYSNLYLDNGSTFCRVFNNVIDQYSYPKGHSGDGKLYWNFSNVEAHGHRIFNNYINVPDVSRIHDEATDIELEPPHIYLDSKWPEEAISIIDNSGLEPEWREKIGGINRNVLDKVVADKKIKLSGNDQIKPDIIPLSVDGKIITDAIIKYTVSDAAVAAVEGGVLKAKSSGRTTLTVEAEYNGVIKTAETEIFVDDALSKIVLEYVPKNLFVGNKFKLKSGFETKYKDNTVENVTITYSTSNPRIMTVDGEDFLIGISEGNAILYVTASTADDSFTAQFPVTVYNSGEFRNLGYNTMSVDRLISDPDGWYFYANNQENERMIVSDGTAKFRTPGSGYGIYTAEKYLDTVFDMNYKYNGINGYCMLALRTQGAKEGPLSKVEGSGCYLVVVKANSIELQRVINGKSYMLYGKLTNNSALGGERDNILMTHGNTYNIKFGAVNYEDGVVLSLTCDGQVIFEYFDNTPDAIREKGHFGLIVWSGSMDLSTPTEDFQRIAEAKAKASESVYFEDILTHWAINDIAYLSGKRVLNGYPDGTFRPDGYITRAEFCKLLAEAVGIEKKSHFASFKDISGNEWYADYLYTLLDGGIIPVQMIEDGHFIPDRYITREEVAVML